MTCAHLTPLYSADLIAFLKAWHDWATSGAPDGEPFSRRYGLCKNAYDFEAGESECDAIYGGLLDLFLDSECLGAYPFGKSDYDNRLRNSTQHECPKRLAWVRARLVEAGELVA